MIKGELNLSVYDYGTTHPDLSFKFNGKTWHLKSWPEFSSSLAAENQTKKIADKLGIEITKIIKD